MNRDFETANKAARERMRSLIESMSDEQLALPTVAGWTIASVLAHIAFWDFRILYLLRHWKENEIAPSPYDVDAINEAHKPLCLALSPRTAANLALQAAQAIDSEIEKTSDEPALVPTARTSSWVATRRPKPRWGAWSMAFPDASRRTQPLVLGP